MSRKIQLSLIALACLCFLSGTPKSADAGTTYEKVYRVEVEYWYWPPDIYYWGTFLETTNEFDAKFALKALELARDGGYLSSVVASSDRHIPVDVKLTVIYRPLPKANFMNLDVTKMDFTKGPPVLGRTLSLWD